MQITDKVVLITGASRGIGEVMAYEFAGQGAKVVLVGRHAETLKEVEHNILVSGGEAITVVADIAEPQDLQALTMEVGRVYGQVDILINNAAVATFKPLVQMTWEEWQEMTGVNLHGMFQLTQTFLPGMIERRSGVIINISAAVARNGFPNLAVYSATKAGIIAFSEALAKEVRRYGIQVYAICPHGVNTELYRSLFGTADPTKLISPQQVATEVLHVAAGES